MRIQSYMVLLLLALQVGCESHTPSALPPPQPSSAATTPAKSAPPAESQIAESREKVAKWRANRDKLKQIQEQLQRDKASLLEKLDQLGVSSDKDVANNREAKALANELKDVLDQQKLVKKKYEEYGIAVVELESRVRIVERQLSIQAAGVTDTELAALTRDTIALDESLMKEKEPELPFDNENMLQEELARYRAERRSAAALPVSSPPPQPAPATAEEQAKRAASPPENVIRGEATAGVGRRSSGYEPGLVTTPVAAYFGARGRAVFEIQIPQVMKLYKEEHERGPRTQEDFMKCIKEQGVRLPDLPEGHRYVYDPATEQLMVGRFEPPPENAVREEAKIEVGKRGSGYEPESVTTRPPPPAPATAEEQAKRAASPPENVIRKEAKVGVGRRGSGYDPDSVTIQEQIAFEVKLPYAMKFYKEGNGRAPKSHEEFMQKIIESYGISLPALPEGHRYVYDPATETLMVERPKPQ